MSGAIDFDTSYKGWKLHTATDEAIFLVNFDTSYKGWKPWKSSRIARKVEISILPIRDGNCRHTVRLF